MATKTNTKQGKRPPRKTQPALHACSQREAISRMNLILVGNGHPEDGLAFVVKQSVKQLNEIKGSVEALHTKYEETLRAATTAQSAIEKYRAESEGYKAGKESMEKSASKTFDKWVRVLGLGFACVMAVIAYYNLRQQTKNLQDTVKKMEVTITKETLK